MSRTIAIGDIQGCSQALAALLSAVRPEAPDTVVTLGDVIDRGPDSSCVVAQLIELAGHCRLVPLLGNHEELMLDALRDDACWERWLRCGGDTALRSYGCRPDTSRAGAIARIPEAHRQFLGSFLPYYETDTHLFLHAGYEPELPLAEQPGLVLRWRVTSAQTARPHCSGRIAVVGHTPQRSGEVLNLGFLLAIDTNCVRGGWLTALDTGSGSFWQADRAGKLRTGKLKPRA
jgi:serine/threonine protein phosphatase 1